MPSSAFSVPVGDEGKGKLIDLLAQEADYGELPGGAKPGTP